MKVAEIIIVAICGILGGLAIYWGIQVHNMPVKLPCAVAEISPDFSHEDREKCRIIRSTKL
jgi:hypothetical protein